MKLRLAVPETIGHRQGSAASAVRRPTATSQIGALTCHDDVARSDLLRSTVPLLANAAGANRRSAGQAHCGTVGGSLAHADPAADLPAVVLALNATLVIRGPEGSREVAARLLPHGLFETSLQPGELLTEIRIPTPRSAGWAFQKFTKRGIDWAIVGVAVQGWNVALVNMGSTPIRATTVEQALASGSGAREAAAHAAEGTSAPTDLNGPRAYREHLARVLVGRALLEAAARG
jgi:carbon-monoxide dehydrogenase medium subunit